MLGCASPFVHRVASPSGQAWGVTGELHTPLLPSLANFRDVGGMTTTDGHRVRTGRLYRSDGLHVLTDEEQQRLVDAHGIRTVIDLRSSMEHERMGSLSPVPGGFDVLCLPIVDGSSMLADGQAGFELGQMYERIALGPDSRIGDVLRALSEPDRLPTVVYCTGGKDRTGVVVAVVLGLLGVPDEAIVQDYERSAGGLPALIDRFHAAFGPGEIPEVPADFFTAPPQAMWGLLHLLRRRCGSLDGYAGHIGLGPQALEDLRAGLLEP
jgi:protein-tyrosine phosphatase